MATFSKGLQVNGHVFLSMCIFLRVATCLIFNDDVLQLLEQKLMYFISPYTLNFELQVGYFCVICFLHPCHVLFIISSNIRKSVSSYAILSLVVILWLVLLLWAFVAIVLIITIMCVDRNFHHWEYLKVQNS